MQDRWMTPALLALNGTLIAAIYACAKLAGGHGVSALGFLAWQVAFAASAMTLVVAARGELPPLTGVNLRYAGVAGVLGVTGPNLITFAALAHLPSGLVGVITALSPMFTYAIALALRIERMQALRAVGIVTGLAGVLFIALPRGTLASHGATPWVLLAMAAPLSLAGGNVYRTLAWPPGLPPMSAAALLLVLQAMFVVPVAVMSGQFVAPSVTLHAPDVTLLIAGALTTGFYLGAFELQRRGGPVVVGQLGYVITIASLVIGMALFDERHTLGTFIAVAAVLAGVALVNRRPARVQAASPASAGMQTRPRRRCRPDGTAARSARRAATAARPGSPAASRTPAAPTTAGT
jgi:drug/metabolite transporter (DMT)-like permease